MVIAKISVLILTCILVLICSLMPQINTSSYIQPTVTSKFIFFMYSCLIVAVVYASIILFQKDKVIRVSKLDLMLFWLLLYIVFNKLFFQTYSSFSIRFFELLGLSLVYLAMRILKARYLVWVLMAVIVSGTIQAVYGNLQLLGYYPSNHSGFKMTGSFFNPGPYAGFLAAVWPIALGIYLFRDTLLRLSWVANLKTSKVWYSIIRYGIECVALLGIISILLVLPASRSRAAWLSVILSSAVLLECRYQILRKIAAKISKLRKVILGAISVLIIAGGLYGVYHLKKGSSDGRLFIWNVSTQIIKENPLIGVGFDRFKAHYMDSQAAYFREHIGESESLVADNSYYAFNEFLQFTVEEGCIGAILLIGVIFLVFTTKPKEDLRFLYVIAIGGIIAISVFAFFSYPMQVLPVKLVLVVLLASLGIIDSRKWQSQPKLNKPIYLLGQTVVVAFLFFGAFKVYTYTRTLGQAYKDWQTAFVTYNYGDYEGALKSYQEAYPLLNKEGDFLMNYGKTLTMAKKHDEAVTVLEDTKHYLNTTIVETALGDAYKALGNYDKAEMAYLNAANMIPVRFYPLYLLAKLYDESGQDNKALTMANTILEKDVKIPSTAIREIKAEMKKMITNKIPSNPTN